MTRILRVGTRKSKLAVTQTNQVIEILKKKYPYIEIEIKEIVTKGDRLVHKSLASIGGQGAFVKEIEHQLLTENIDFAVHSLKDVPTLIPSELTMGAVLKRANPFDCLIFRQTNQTLKTLPQGAIIGTSSMRRQAEILKSRPDVKIVPIRGNVDTRIRKLHAEKMDAIVLAVAGIARLGITKNDVALEYLPPEVCLPAVGQGALGIECRREDAEIVKYLQAITDEETSLNVLAERTFLSEMDGSCTFPIGGYAEKTTAGIQLTGMVASVDGKKQISATVCLTDPVAVGKKVAQALLSQGAAALIEESKING